MERQIGRRYYRPYEEKSDSESEGSEVGSDLSMSRTAGPDFATFARQLQYDRTSIQRRDTASMETPYDSFVSEELKPPVSKQYEKSKNGMERKDQTTLYLIDSKNRDRDAYPQPTSFMLKTPRPYKNITSIQITQIKLLSSFFYFRKAKANITLPVIERYREDINEYLLFPLTEAIQIREGTYNINELLTEIQQWMNFTPLFYDFPDGGFNQFVTVFPSTGDLGTNFNEPGDTYYDSLTNKFIANPTKDLIVSFYWRQRFAGLSTYSNNQILVAYYYPVLFELILDENDTEYRPNLNLDGVEQSRIIYNAQGLDDPVILNLINLNIAILDPYRTKHTFRYSLVNRYLLTYEANTLRVNIYSLNLNTSLVNLFNLTRQRSLATALQNAGFTSNSFSNTSNALNRANVVFLDMYRYLQDQLVQYFAIDYGTYTSQFFLDDTNEILIRNGLEATGVLSNYTAESVRRNPISSTNYNYPNSFGYWPRMNSTNTVAPGVNCGGIDPSGINVSTSMIPFNIGSSNFLYGSQVIDSSNFFFQTARSTRSVDSIITVRPSRYTVFKFRSPARQTLQVETLPLPYYYRYADFNKTGRFTGILDPSGQNVPQKYFDLSYAFVFSNTGSFQNNLMDQDSSVYSSFNLPFPFGQTSTTSFLASPITEFNPVGLNSYQYEFQASYPFSVPPGGIYAYPTILRFQAVQNESNANPGIFTDTVFGFLYHDRAAFMADIYNASNENPYHYIASNIAESNDTVMDFRISTFTNQRYYAIFRTADTAFTNMFFKPVVFQPFSASTIVQITTDYNTFNPLDDPFAASNLNKYPFVTNYNSNFIRLPIGSTLQGIDPSNPIYNINLQQTVKPIGYDISGVSNDLTDYRGYNAGQRGFVPNTRNRVDPLSRFTFQFNSAFDSNANTYFPPGSSNRLLFPISNTPYNFKGVSTSEIKIVNWYDNYSIPRQLNDGFTTSNNLGNSVTSSIGELFTGIPGFTFGPNGLVLGRGIGAIGFLPQDGLYEIDKFTFKSALYPLRGLSTTTEDPNTRIKYVGVFQGGYLGNNTQIPISSALAVLRLVSTTVFSPSTLSNTPGFGSELGTYYDYKFDESFVPAEDVRITGYTQGSSELLSYDSMYYMIPFNEEGSNITFTRLTGSVVPYPLFSKPSTAFTYVDGQTAQAAPSTSNQPAYIIPSTMGGADSNLGPQGGYAVTQAQYEQSQPITTNSLGYVEYGFLLRDPDTLFTFTTVFSTGLVSSIAASNVGQTPFFTEYNNTLFAVNSLTNSTLSKSDLSFKGTEYASTISTSLAVSGTKSSIHYLLNKPSTLQNYSFVALSNVFSSFLFQPMAGQNSTVTTRAVEINPLVSSATFWLWGAGGATINNSPLTPSNIYPYGGAGAYAKVALNLEYYREQYSTSTVYVVVGKGGNLENPRRNLAQPRYGGGGNINEPIQTVVAYNSLTPPIMANAISSITFNLNTGLSAFSTSRIVYGLSNYVAVDAVANVKYSIDSSNWTTVASPGGFGAGIPRAIAHTGSNFTVGVEDEIGVGLVNSQDGLTWARAGAAGIFGPTGTIKKIAYGAGALYPYLAVGTDGTDGVVAYSKDGVNYTKANTGSIFTGRQVLSAAYFQNTFGSQWVVGGDSESAFAYSTNSGVSWSQFTISGFNPNKCVDIAIILDGNNISTIYWFFLGDSGYFATAVVYIDEFNNIISNLATGSVPSGATAILFQWPLVHVIGTDLSNTAFIASSADSMGQPYSAMFQTFTIGNFKANSITYDGSLYIVGGEQPTGINDDIIYYNSTVSTTWAPWALPVNNSYPVSSIKSIVYSPTEYMAFGGGSTIMRATSLGSTWSTVGGLYSYSQITTATWDGTRYLTGGFYYPTNTTSTTMFAITKSNITDFVGAISIDSIGTPTYDGLSRLSLQDIIRKTDTDGLAYVVSRSNLSTYVYTTSNYLVWNPQSTPLAFSTVTRVGSDGTDYVAVGTQMKPANGGKIMYSATGSSWSIANSGTIFGTSSGIVNDVASDGTRWVAVGKNDSGAGKIAYSLNRVTWIDTGVTFFSGPVTAVVFTGSYWLAAGTISGSFALARSSNGITWQQAGSIPASLSVERFVPNVLYPHGIAETDIFEGAAIQGGGFTGLFADSNMTRPLVIVGGGGGAGTYTLGGPGGFAPLPSTLGAIQYPVLHVSCTSAIYNFGTFSGVAPCEQYIGYIDPIVGNQRNPNNLIDQNYTTAYGPQINTAITLAPWSLVPTAFTFKVDFYFNSNVSTLNGLRLYGEINNTSLFPSTVDVYTSLDRRQRLYSKAITADMIQYTTTDQPYIDLVGFSTIAMSSPSTMYSYIATGSNLNLTDPSNSGGLAQFSLDGRVWISSLLGTSSMTRNITAITCSNDIWLAGGYSAAGPQLQFGAFNVRSLPGSFSNVSISGNGQYMIGLSNSFVKISRNFGSNWVDPVSPGTTSPSFVTAISATGKHMLFRYKDPSAPYGAVYKSDDYGSNFSLLPNLVGFNADRLHISYDGNEILATTSTLTTPQASPTPTYVRFLSNAGAIVPNPPIFSLQTYGCIHSAMSHDANVIALSFNGASNYISRNGFQSVDVDWKPLITNSIYLNPLPDFTYCSTVSMGLSGNGKYLLAIFDIYDSTGNPVFPGPYGRAFRSSNAGIECVPLSDEGAANIINSKSITISETGKYTYVGTYGPGASDIYNDNFMFYSSWQGISGVNWEVAVMSGDGQYLHGLTSANTLYRNSNTGEIVPQTESFIKKSTDGITWSRVSILDHPSTDNLKGFTSIEYSDTLGLWIAAGPQTIFNTPIYWSYDSENWTTAGISVVPQNYGLTYTLGNNSLQGFCNVRWLDGAFWGIGDIGQACALKSIDGLQWQAVLSCPANRDIAYGGGKYVAVGTGSFPGFNNNIIYSEDGNTWFDTNGLFGAYNFTSIVYGKGKFVAATNFGTFQNLLYSTDGINWSTIGFTTGGVNRLRFINNRFFAACVPNGPPLGVGNTPQGSILSSEDGISWSYSIDGGYKFNNSEMANDVAFGPVLYRPNLSTMNVQFGCALIERMPIYEVRSIFGNQFPLSTAGTHVAANIIDGNLATYFAADEEQVKDLESYDFTFKFPNFSTNVNRVDLFFNPSTIYTPSGVRIATQTTSNIIFQQSNAVSFTNSNGYSNYSLYLATPVSSFSNLFMTLSKNTISSINFNEARFSFDSNYATTQFIPASVQDVTYNGLPVSTLSNISNLYDNNLATSWKIEDIYKLSTLKLNVGFGTAADRIDRIQLFLDTYTTSNSVLGFGVYGDSTKNLVLYSNNALPVYRFSNLSYLDTSIIPYYGVQNLYFEIYLNGEPFFNQLSLRELRFMRVGGFYEPATGYTGGTLATMARQQTAALAAYGGGGGGTLAFGLPGEGGSTIVYGIGGSTIVNSIGYGGSNGSLYVGGTASRNAGNQSTIANFANIVAGSGGGGGGLQGGGGGGTENRIIYWTPRLFGDGQTVINSYTSYNIQIPDTGNNSYAFIYSKMLLGGSMTFNWNWLNGNLSQMVLKVYVSGGVDDPATLQESYFFDGGTIFAYGVDGSQSGQYTVNFDAGQWVMIAITTDNIFYPTGGSVAIISNLMFQYDGYAGGAGGGGGGFIASSNLVGVIEYGVTNPGTITPSNYIVSKTTTQDQFVQQGLIPAITNNLYYGYGGQPGFSLGQGSHGLAIVNYDTPIIYTPPGGPTSATPSFVDGSKLSVFESQINYNTPSRSIRFTPYNDPLQQTSFRRTNWVWYRAYLNLIGLTLTSNLLPNSTTPVFPPPEFPNLPNLIYEVLEEQANNISTIMYSSFTSITAKSQSPLIGIVSDAMALGLSLFTTYFTATPYTDSKYIEYTEIYATLDYLQNSSNLINPHLNNRNVSLDRVFGGLPRFGYWANPFLTNVSYVGFDINSSYYAPSQLAAITGNSNPVQAMYGLVLEQSLSSGKYALKELIAWRPNSADVASNGSNWAKANQFTESVVVRNLSNVLLSKNISAQPYTIKNAIEGKLALFQYQVYTTPSRKDNVVLNTPISVINDYQGYESFFYTLQNLQNNPYTTIEVTKSNMPSSFIGLNQTNITQLSNTTGTIIGTINTDIPFSTLLKAVNKFGFNTTDTADFTPIISTSFGLDNYNTVIDNSKLSISTLGRTVLDYNGNVYATDNIGSSRLYQNLCTFKMYYEPFTKSTINFASPSYVLSEFNGGNPAPYTDSFQSKYRSIWHAQGTSNLSTIYGVRLPSPFDFTVATNFLQQVFIPTHKITLTKKSSGANPIVDTLDLDTYPYYPHTEMFMYSNFSSLVNDVSGNFALENSSNFAYAASNSGYYFFSYLDNVNLARSEGPTANPDNFNYLAIRGYSPSETFKCLVRFYLPNRYDFGYISLRDLSNEIVTIQADSNVNPDYLRVMGLFNSSFAISRTFGSQGVPGFPGSNISSTQFGDFLNNYRSVYNSIFNNADTVSSINAQVQADLQALILGDLRFILPSNIAFRERIEDPIEFKLPFSTIMPETNRTIDEYGMGYNLGYAKRDTDFNTIHRAESFFKILDDYIYLKMNPEFNMNRLDISRKENFKETQDPTAESQLYNCKLLLNNFGQYAQTVIQNPVFFNPPIGKLDRLSFQWYDITGQLIDNAECEWSGAVQVVERMDVATADSTDGGRAILPGLI